ncbi:tyrosine-type recombinase/integrase [Mycobacterium sp. M23085]|uniref:tyrosine-type recombinase/integrase n=1 Tax=Mycobacterium sp. M23085 TaxID=3378087 RepID=UPI0038782E81
MAKGTSAQTRRIRRAHIRSMARRLGAASPAAVSETDLVRVVGAAGTNEYRRSLGASFRSFFGWCASTGCCPLDVAAGLPKVSAPCAAPKPATDEIWKQILATADKRTLLMARLACEAGLRRAEVAKVHSDDVIDDADGPQLIVHGKGGKQRAVPLSAELAATLTAEFTSRSRFLFPGQIDGHVSPDYVGRLVSKAMPQGWSMHKLRHRFATRGFLGTGNLRAVQEALGHTSVATTQRYTAVAQRDLRAVSEAAAWPIQPKVFTQAVIKTDPNPNAIGEPVVQNVPLELSGNRTPDAESDALAEELIVEDDIEEDDAYVQMAEADAKYVPNRSVSDHTQGNPYPVDSSGIGLAEADIFDSVMDRTEERELDGGVRNGAVAGHNLDTRSGVAGCDVSFEAVISAWDRVARCEMPTHQGDPCRRPANWRLNLHGCEQALMCGRHKSSWVRAALRAAPRFCCGLCEREFDRLDDACSITRL